MIHLYRTRMATYASRALGRLSEVDVHPVMLRPLIGAYARYFGISMDEVEIPEDGYRSFSDFFVRKLRSAARPVCQDERAFIAPCDGEVVQFGEICGTDVIDFSIKGDRYNLNTLLGREDAGADFKDGGYMVFYLHPRDYHRVHCPFDCSLSSIRQIPGARYPVNDWAVKRTDGIYQKNERVVFEFESELGYRFALTMVSAFGVGNIDLPFYTGWDRYTSEVRKHDFETPLALERGNEVGAFRLGSTVVVNWSKDAIEIDEQFVPGAFEYGRRIGKLNDVAG